MLPIRYDPQRDRSPLANFRREMDRLFGDFFGELDRPMYNVERDLPAGTFDLDETDNGYELSCELPGFDPKDVKVELHGDTLTIQAQTSAEQKEGKRRERSSRQFFRSFTLPGTIDATKIGAKLQHGLLTLTLPKSEAVKPRQIEVKSGPTGAATPQITTKEAGGQTGQQKKVA